MADSYAMDPTDTQETITRWAQSAAAAELIRMNTIVGLHLHIPGQEVIDLVNEARLRLQESYDNIAATIETDDAESEKPRQKIARQSLQEIARQIEWLRFMAARLIPGLTYILPTYDARELWHASKTSPVNGPDETRPPSLPARETA